MKILTINRSPNLNGCTARALTELENTLKECGIEVERINVGNKDLTGSRCRDEALSRVSMAEIL